MVARLWWWLWKWRAAVWQGYGFVNWESEFVACTEEEEPRV
jgi:hypothetical protein